MTEPSRPTFLRRKLGAKLRRLREEARLNLDDAAPKLDKTRSVLQRVESGETKADVHLVRSMMDIYDRYDEGLLDEVREALKPPWYRAYGTRNMGYVDVETEAARVNQFLAIDIPGLLQTEPYMRAMFYTERSRTAEEMNNAVAVRLIRQRRLTSEDRPLELVAVVYEAAFRHEIGGREVMRGQLRHLIEMSELPAVTLLAVPLDGGGLRVPIGQFTLLGRHSGGLLPTDMAEEQSQQRCRQCGLCRDRALTSLLLGPGLQEPLRGNPLLPRRAVPRVPRSCPSGLACPAGNDTAPWIYANTTTC